MHRELVAAAAHGRGASLGAPGAAGDLVGADADLIGEAHLTTLGLRPGPDRRPGLLPPEAARFRVLLDGPLVRALEGQALARQVPAHPLFGQPYPVQLRDQIPHPGRVHIPRPGRVHGCPVRPRSQER